MCVVAEQQGKSVVVANREGTPEVDQEGFQKALRPIRVRTSLNAQTSTRNMFQLLIDDALQIETMNEVLQEAEKGVGEPPPSPGG